MSLLAGLSQQGDSIAAHNGDAAAHQLNTFPSGVSPYFQLQKPAPFEWSGQPFRIRRTADGVISTDLNVAALKPAAGVTYYVNGATGLNTNNGLTPETALKYVNTARAKADVNTIIVASGYYTDETGFNGELTVNKSIAIIAAEGADVTISTARKLTWSKTAGRTNVYNATRSLTAAVYDAAVPDVNEDFTKLALVADVTTVDSTPGSYYIDESNVVYVHTVNSRAADTDCFPMLNVANFQNVGNYQTYLEGIKFHGGNNGCALISCSASGNTTKLVAVNCEFKYNSGGSGALTMLGADSVLVNCVAACAKLDGFNYHAANSRICSSVEINCTGRDNGVSYKNGINNGSTSHDASRAIRVNGIYLRNGGPNLADVSGAQSWNVGCTVGVSSGASASRRIGIMSGDNTGVGAEIWLDSCTTSAQIPLVVDTGSVAHMHAMTLPSGGTITGDLFSY